MNGSTRQSVTTNDRPTVRRYRSVVADSARWASFPFRDDDIVISAPNKCGTTWTQMICALLIFQDPSLPQPLDVLSPWLDMLTRGRAAVVAALEAQRHRRFIKTHTPLDGLPFDERVTYLCVGRDPRDVGISWGHHVANLDVAAFLEARRAAVGLDDLENFGSAVRPVIADSELERFWRWVDDPAPPTTSAANLWGALHHFATFMDVAAQPNVVLFHYSELEADLEGEMRRLAERIGIEVTEERWPGLVSAATFEQMRRRADELAPGVSHRAWQDNRRFFHRGRSGQWRSLLDAEGLGRYRRRVNELADLEVSIWAHRPALP